MELVSEDEFGISADVMHAAMLNDKLHTGGRRKRRRGATDGKGDDEDED